jgi:hypothetical protein
MRPEKCAQDTGAASRRAGLAKGDSLPNADGSLRPPGSQFKVDRVREINAKTKSRRC